MERVREITECCICMDTYTDPRILSCIHTFCLKCLEDIALRGKSNPGDPMPCPLCRKTFVIPVEGMVGVQKNFFMESLLEISKLPESSSNVLLCDTCKSEIEEEEEDKEEEKQEAKEIPPAVKFCIECRQNICARCCREHKKFRNLQNHQIVQIGGQLKDELTKKASLQHCTLHGKEELKLYCDDCKEIICMMCFVQKHKTHNCSCVEEVAEKLRKQIKCDTERIRGYTEETTANICQIDTLQINFQKQVENIEKDIIERGAELKNLVDKCIKSLMDELDSIKQQTLKEIKSKRDESETHKLVIQSFEAYCTELSSKGSSAEICRAASSVHLRAEELQKEHEKLKIQQNEQIYLTEVNFQASNVEQLLQEENIVGKIRVKSTPAVQVIGTLECTCWDLDGVTKLGNNIYILCGNSKAIFVFHDEIPFQRQTCIILNETGNPGEIGSSEKLRCLFVTDLSKRCIWKIAEDDHRVTKWLTMKYDIPFNVSVTREGHLLVLIGPSSYYLEIYGSDAKRILRLSLPRSIKHPQQVIQKDNGEFIISYLTYDSSSCGGQYAISRLTKDGQTVIHSTNAVDSVLPEVALKNSCHLAWDSDNDRIFATNCREGRVFLIDSTSLNLIKILLTKEENGIASPYRLFYDEKKKQLIVAQTTGEVQIYRMSNALYSS